VDASLKANVINQITRKEKQGVRIISELAFPEHEGVDKRMYPERMQVNTLLYRSGKKADVAVTIYKKPAVRLPETYWLSFNADNIRSIIAEKVGERVGAKKLFWSMWAKQEVWDIPSINLISMAESTSI